MEELRPTLGGAIAAEGGLAGLQWLDRMKPYEEVQFPNADERIMTRLGEEESYWLLTLCRSVLSVGKFRESRFQLNLPTEYRIPNWKSVEVIPTSEGLTLQVAERRFTYTREGLNSVTIKRHLRCL